MTLAPPAAPGPFGPLRTHGRFGYRAIHQRADWDWPGGARLAVYLGYNLEHFAFGEGLGAAIGPRSPEPDVLNHAWREWGNRVGAWRCLELFDELALPTAAIVNTSVIDHAPSLVRAHLARGDELVGHGHTNAVHQGGLDEPAERALLQHCRDALAACDGGRAPRGWLSPWIAETHHTPDLLAETGWRYTLNWCHDDQPTRMRCRDGSTLWAVPYPQELNDIPMLVARQQEMPAFTQSVLDALDVMLQQSARQPLVMGIALHPYLVGQPHRLKHLRTMLERLAAQRDGGAVWFTTPGAVVDHMDRLVAERAGDDFA